MTRLLSHARSNLIAYVALFVALGGTSYATISISNHSITPVKLDPRDIGGYVRAWASVTATGRVGASAGGVRVIPDPGVAPGHYIIDWHPRPTSPCTAVGSVDFTGGAPVAGYVIAGAASSPGRGEQSTVQTYDPQGQPTALAYDVELLCGTPR
jgi:hypothetical protein